MTAVIQVEGLDNAFAGVYVHKNLSFTLQEGDIVGIVGGSGTGKSVLLRSIVGLHRPTAGRIRLLGQPLSPALGQSCGVLFQAGALFSSLTVLENVAFVLIEQRGLSRRDAERIALFKLKLVGLPEDSVYKYPAALSGGMIKRAALARALALDPPLLFLDEPTAGLDPIAAAAFDALIVTLRDALGLSVFLITHDVDTLYAACDKVAVLYNQQVLIQDRIEVVQQYDNPWVQSYFQGERGRQVASAYPPFRSS